MGAEKLGGMCDEGCVFDLLEQVLLNRVCEVQRRARVECVSVRFARRPPPSVEQVRVLRQCTCEAQALGCPSMPAEALVVHDGWPQPSWRDYRHGAGVSVGIQCRTSSLWCWRTTLPSGPLRAALSTPSRKGLYQGLSRATRWNDALVFFARKQSAFASIINTLSPAPTQG